MLMLVLQASSRAVKPSPRETESPSPCPSARPRSGLIERLCKVGLGSEPVILEPELGLGRKRSPVPLLWLQLRSFLSFLTNAPSSTLQGLHPRWVVSPGDSGGGDLGGRFQFS